MVAFLCWRKVIWGFMSNYIKRRLIWEDIMIQIKHLTIKRFRSIMDIHVDIDNSNNYITICGENNSGKTNMLRALNLFFNPETYVAEKDCPHHKYYGSRGGLVYPEITVDFSVNKKDLFRIRRNFNQDGLEKTVGEKLKVTGIREKKEQLKEKEIHDFLKKISFFYVESVNISLPNLINNIIDDIYDIEYENSQFRGIKKELKDSFEKYVKGLLDILSQLSNEITPVFKQFKENWGVGFDLNADITKFRDLITDDVLFYINDNSNQRIDSKGAGLQRLAYVLLHFRIIQKIKNKSVILLIDEPDVYLHQGLQKKLHQHLIELTDKSQVIITSHSNVFIDTYTLKNVFLLDLNIRNQYFKRTKRYFNILETFVVNLDDHDGSRKIKNYLGIEEFEHELLDRYNIIVEGETDKNYIVELSRYFQFKVPRIIPANGADKIEKFLEFYNSYYQNMNDDVPLPNILVLLDNDNKGREVYKRLNGLKSKNKLKKIIFDIKFVPNFLGEIPEVKSLNKVNTDQQIEDLIYPKLFCFLINKLLEKNSMKTINENDIIAKITKAAHKDRGILYLVENEKNNNNPDYGHKIIFISSSHASESIKHGLSGFLKIEGNKRLSRLIESEHLKYPEVKKFIEFITNAKNFKVT